MTTRTLTVCHNARLAVPFTYPVIFTEDVFASANPVLADLVAAAREQPAANSGNGAPPLRARVFFDAGLVAAQPELPAQLLAYGRAQAPELAAEAPGLCPGGEVVKDGWAHVQTMIADLAARRLCRHSLVVAVGGGAFLDAVGFATALVHRGVRLVRLPSTALSQDDSGVGVKNGINFGGQKNFLGTFAPPWAVVNDLNLLRTLAPAVAADGVAEAFKVAIIKDAAFFAWLSEHAAALRAGDLSLLKEVVQRCAQLHLAHITGAGDPFERGQSRPLDFGHWAAHRLESLSGYQLRHGQAVAIGLALDSLYARDCGLLEPAELDQVLTALAAAGLPTWHPLLKARDADGELAVVAGLEQFREHLGGVLAITLPQGLGRQTEVHEMDLAAIERAIAELDRRQRAAGPAEGSSR